MRARLGRMAQGLGLVWRCSPSATLGLLGLTLLGVVLPLGIAYVGKSLVDAVVAHDQKRALLLVGVELLLVVLQTSMQRVSGLVRGLLGARLSVDGQPLLELYDTPGLEDAIALLDYLERLEQPGERLDGPARIARFLASSEARQRFEQEAKVLRQLLRRRVAEGQDVFRVRVVVQHVVPGQRLALEPGQHGPHAQPLHDAHHPAAKRRHLAQCAHAAVDDDQRFLHHVIAGCGGCAVAQRIAADVRTGEAQQLLHRHGIAAACGGQQLFELLAVALAEGLVHLQQGVVATVLRLDKGRSGGQHGGGHKGCQNRSEQLHGGII